MKEFIKPYHQSQLGIPGLYLNEIAINLGVNKNRLLGIIDKTGTVAKLRMRNLDIVAIKDEDENGREFTNFIFSIDAVFYCLKHLWDDYLIVDPFLEYLQEKYSNKTKSDQRELESRIKQLESRVNGLPLVFFEEEASNIENAISSRAKTLGGPRLRGYLISQIKNKFGNAHLHTPYQAQLQLGQAPEIIGYLKNAKIPFPVLRKYYPEVYADHRDQRFRED